MDADRCHWESSSALCFHMSCARWLFQSGICIQGYGWNWNLRGIFDLEKKYGVFLTRQGYAFSSCSRNLLACLSLLYKGLLWDHYRKLGLKTQSGRLTAAPHWAWRDSGALIVFQQSIMHQVSPRGCISQLPSTDLACSDSVKGQADSPAHCGCYSVNCFGALFFLSKVQWCISLADPPLHKYISLLGKPGVGNFKMKEWYEQLNVS